MTGLALPADTRRLHCGICDHTGKRQFTTKRRAKTVSRTLGRGMHAYRCLWCDYWHTGHRGNFTREQHERVALG